MRTEYDREELGTQASKHSLLAVICSIKHLLCHLILSSHSTPTWKVGNRATQPDTACGLAGLDVAVEPQQNPRKNKPKMKEKRKTEAYKLLLHLIWDGRSIPPRNSNRLDRAWVERFHAWPETHVPAPNPCPQGLSGKILCMCPCPLSTSTGISGPPAPCATTAVVRRRLRRAPPAAVGIEVGEESGELG
mgnify:CR=1 FL=1